MEHIIDEFQDEYRFLSNFYVSPFMFGNIKIETTEHLYQSLKTDDKTEKYNILKAETPGKAKRMGSKVILRDNWDKNKYEIMLICLKIKFFNKKLMKMLINTGDSALIEGNYWHDNYWGNCKCKKCVNITGKNTLGLLLMHIRRTNEIK